MMKKAVLYLNQYFGQIGGEDSASYRTTYTEGALGAGILLSELLKDTQIVQTIRSGDNYFNENTEEALAEIVEFVRQVKPDVLIAGPAFNAGRYGMACATICARVQEELKIPAVTAMYPENPAVLLYRKKLHIAETGKSAASMREAANRLAKLADAAATGRIPEDTGALHCIPQGRRINFFHEKNGAARALDLLEKKLSGEPYRSEIPLPIYDQIEPAQPISDLSKSKIALVTTGGIVPVGNPDHLPAATAKAYYRYAVPVSGLAQGEFESVHAGYDPVYANENPNRIAPADALIKMQNDGRIGDFCREYFVTTGNSTSVSDAVRMGKEIARALKADLVDGVIVTST